MRAPSETTSPFLGSRAPHGGVTCRRRTQRGSGATEAGISFAGMSPTIERLRITIADMNYALAPVEHLEDVKAAITAAVHAGGGFVDLTLDNGQRLSVLVTACVLITIVVETLRLDSGTADGEESPGWDVGARADYDADTTFDII